MSRMAWIVEELAAGGASPILLRGSDSPALPADVVDRALAALREADVVLSPDRDGGYNLTVLEDTLASARSLSLRTHILEPGFDIDTIADLQWLDEARRRGETVFCPRTLASLDEWDLWRYSTAASRSR
jgi:glycosyltransferase A (GT-A) superfamily protein (DUF2064 family)